MKATVFWNVPLCSLTDTYRHFGGMYCFNLQVNIQEDSNLHEVTLTSHIKLMPGCNNFRKAAMFRENASLTMQNCSSPSDGYIWKS
jgi:hypothetical protein